MVTSGAQVSNMGLTTDIYLEHDVDWVDLKRSLGLAYSLPLDAVAVDPALSEDGLRDWADDRVRVLAQPRALGPGEFPASYTLCLKDLDAHRFVLGMGTLARSISVAILSDEEVDSYSDVAYNLALPDGSLRRVELDYDAFERDELALKPSDRKVLERSRKKSHAVD